jgi:Isochorismatase family
MRSRLRRSMTLATRRCWSLWVQNGFVRDASRHVVPVIADLVDRWQAAGLDVVFTRYFNTRGSQFERLFGWTGLQGPPETDIVPELTAQVSGATAVVDKRIYAGGPTSTSVASPPRAASSRQQRTPSSKVTSRPGSTPFSRHCSGRCGGW